MLTPVSELIKTSFTLYRDNAKLFLQYVALIYLPTIFISLVTNTLAIIGQGKQGLELFLLLGGLGFLIASIVSLWISIAFIRVIAARAEGQSPGTVSEEAQTAKALLLPAIIASILAGLAAFGGFLLFIIPGVIFFVWFAFSLYAVALDQKKNTNALRQSRELVRGHWWDVAVRLLAFGLIYAAGVLAIQWLLIRPLDMAFPATTVTLASIFFNLLGSLIGFVYIALFLPFLTAGQTLLYLDLKRIATTAPPSPPNPSLEPPMHP